MTDWQTYLATFHSQQPGITEDVLDRVLDRGCTPYDWVAEALPPGLNVLDLACGSGPMHARLNADRYLGLDLSSAELTRARARSLNVARADAGQLPLADQAVDAVVMSMALMLVPLERTLMEVRRVLRPGGFFVATVPSNRPLPATDWLRYARLCWALRHPGLAYPNDRALKPPAEVFRAAGLTLCRDEVRPFSCQVRDTVVGEQLLASLYLPDVKPERILAARQVVHGWVGRQIATPIRRFVARR